MNSKSFFYYPADVTIPEPLGVVTFKQFLRANKNPNPDISGIFEQISAATNIGDMELKHKLPLFKKLVQIRFCSVHLKFIIIYRVFS